jgi:hypothetical protein
LKRLSMMAWTTMIPSSWWKRLVVFFHMVVALSLTNIYIRGFQPVTRYTNIILENGVWLELECVSLNQTNRMDG